MASVSNTVAVSMADAAVDALDVGSANPAGTLRIYSGTPPARPDDALVGNTLLAEHVLTNPAAGAAVDVPASNLARSTFNSIGDDVAINATGTASFARLFNRDDVAKLQCSVSATGGGGELQFNSVAFQINAKATITAFTWDQPES